MHKHDEDHANLELDGGVGGEAGRGGGTAGGRDGTAGGLGEVKEVVG